MRNPGKTNDRQQHREPYDPNPTLTDNPMPTPSPVAVLEFATPEAQISVIGPLREKYDNTAAFAGAEWQQASQCQADMDKWAQEIEDAKRIKAEAEQRIDDRQTWIEQRGGDKQRHMVHGKQACDVANPLAVLLRVAGVEVPTLDAPVIEAALFPVVSQDMKVHPLDTSKPLGVVQSPSQGPLLENPPVGHCIRCGQEVWRVAASDTSPNGVTHGWGGTCDPNAKEPEFADLGEGRAVAS